MPPFKRIRSTLSGFGTWRTCARMLGAGSGISWLKESHVFAGGSLCQTEFTDQAVLEGSPEAFDVSLGLRGVSWDLLDAEFVEGSSDLGWELLAGQLLGHRPVGIVALEDAVAVAIEAEGHAVTGEELKQAEVSGGVLGRPGHGWWRRPESPAGSGAGRVLPASRDGWRR